ncbi:g4037 [Coccomyxa elongata]
MPRSVRKGLALAYIKWPDMEVGMQWHVNGCRDEPRLIMKPEFMERIEALGKACELLENMDPLCIGTDMVMRVFVSPYNHSYAVRVLLSVEPLKKCNSSSRPAGGRVAALMEAGKRKRQQRDA